MFFELVARNSKRNRKENGLFFSTLLIAIVAFYLILSLSHQDVMLFLKEMESDAVNKLLLMVPMFYLMTLFVLFFLIYLASKYQMESRKHEFGMYLMLGMRRYRLFFLLLAEDIRNSITALVIGLPVGILLSELISLITAKLVGLGIIGHRFSMSMEAILLTVAGFLAIKFLAFLLLSGKIARQEIGELLEEKPEGTKKQLPVFVYLIALVMGTFLLGTAYAHAIRGESWMNLTMMAKTLVFGFTGTLLIFFGLRAFLALFAKKMGKGQQLHTFTFRQLQEMVIHKSNTMAISSLLVLAALCCFGSGIAMAVHYGKSEQHTIDYTFRQEQEAVEVEKQLKTAQLENLFGTVFAVKAGFIQTEEEEVFSMESVMDLIRQEPDSIEKEVMLNNFGYATYPYLIEESGYNHLLELAGVPQLSLAENEAAVYMDKDFSSDSRTKILNRILETKPEVFLAKEPFYLTGEIQNTNLVVDRSITLSFALIVPDEVFERLTARDCSTFVNATLSKEQLEGKSLIAAVMDVNEQLDIAGISYESYLQNLGRQLFYVVAASYITIYLAIVFLMIANTVIGVQFLTQLQRTKRRYQTLIRIGATYQSLCYSAKKQIYWYFGIPVLLAAVSSIFGIRALFSGFLPGRTDNNMSILMLTSVAMILLLCMVEYGYITAVVKSSKRYLLALMTPQREE